MTADVTYAVDTSVAVPLVVASHEHHAAVAAWASDRTLALSCHALVETYSVLTRLPGDARVAPGDAVTLIDENFAGVLAMSAATSREVHHHLAESTVAGGATYDALVALAARDRGAVLVTRDARARSTYEALGVTVEVLTDGPRAT